MEEIRRDAETPGNACECYVNTAEIKQGRWQEDPGECLRNCKAEFLRRVRKGWQENDGWVEGCGSLNRGVAAQEFWSLYWCDSTFCGVGVNQGGGLGQDPSVDLIINTCQNIGFYSILDPGPPPPNFSCRTEAGTSTVCSATMMQVPQATQGRQPGVASPVSASTTPRTMTTTTQAKSTPAVVASKPTSAPPATTESPASPAASTTSGSNLTGQGKAAIAVCSVLALILLVTFALVWLRRRKRRKASFHRALSSRRGLPHDGAPAGSPTPLISPTSSAIGIRTILAPPLRLRDRRFLPSILRPGSRSPSPPLTPLTPAYSPQPGGGGGGGGVFPSSPICSPTVNKLTPRHERSGALTAATPRTYTGYPPTTFQKGGGLDSPESTFSLPVPIPGGDSSSWLPPLPPSPAGDNHNGHNNRGSACASSCYTGGTSSTAHSLRHEIPIGIPFFMGGAGGGSGSVRGGMSGSGRDATPPPLFSTPPSHPPPPAPPGSPPPPSSPWPCRPARPHEGMLQIPDLVKPAAAGGAGAAAGSIVSVGGSRAASVATPPPPPPLSPPPTRALPKTPTGTVSPPPLKGSARGSPVPGSGSVSPPPAYHRVERARGDGRSPPPAHRLLGVWSPIPGAVPGAGVAGASPYRYDHVQSAGSHGAPEVRPQQELDGRASWGSWSGTGTVVGGSSYHASSASNVNVLAGVGAEAGAAEGGSGGNRAEVVSPRTSQSSGVMATGDTMVSAVSRMSSMRDDTVSDRL